MLTKFSRSLGSTCSLGSICRWSYSRLPWCHCSWNSCVLRNKRKLTFLFSNLKKLTFLCDIFLGFCLCVHSFQYLGKFFKKLFTWIVHWSVITFVGNNLKKREIHKCGFDKTKKDISLERNVWYRFVRRPFVMICSLDYQNSIFHLNVQQPQYITKQYKLFIQNLVIIASRQL